MIKMLEVNPNKDWLLYHGGPRELRGFNSGILFMTDDEFEAVEFGKGSHIFGQYGRVSYIHIIAAKPGKTYDADDVVMAFIMNEEHPEIGTYTGDLDSFLEEIFAPRLRKKGYRYMTFEHPSNLGGGSIEVTVSLYPDKDLEIFDVSKL